MRWRDNDEVIWEREEQARQFKNNTLYLRKHYQSLHLLRAEIRQLEEEKKRIAEATPAVDWSKIKVKGDINDPTFWAVQRLLELEERHFWATRTLQALEWARDQLTPEERQLFDGYILEARPISEIARRTGASWDKTKRRLVRVCEKMANRLFLFLKEERE